MHLPTPESTCAPLTGRATCFPFLRMQMIFFCWIHGRSLKVQGHIERGDNILGRFNYNTIHATCTNMILANKKDWLIRNFILSKLKPHFKIFCLKKKTNITYKHEIRTSYSHATSLLSFKTSSPWIIAKFIMPNKLTEANSKILHTSIHKIWSHTIESSPCRLNRWHIKPKRRANWKLLPFFFFFKPRQTKNAVPVFAGSCRHLPQMESTRRNSRMRIKFFASTCH